jgi:hypothetical protein
MWFESVGSLLLEDLQARQGWVARGHLQAVVPASAAGIHGD